MNDTPKPTTERGKHLREAADIARGMIFYSPSVTAEKIALFLSDFADANDAIAAEDEGGTK